MDVSITIALWVQVIVGLIWAAAWVVFFYYLFKKWRRRKTEPGSLIPPVVYGAWQGHNLGTTTLDPGGVTEIEKDLKTAAHYSEESNLAP
jgi:hypothetical protein